MESQKQLALAEMKASSLNSSTSGGAQAKQDVEMINAQMKEEELARMRQENLISEQVYQEQLTQIQVDQITSRTQMETMLNEQRIQMLGLSPEGLQLKLENARIQSEAEQEILLQKYIDTDMTDTEYKRMSEEKEMQHKLNLMAIEDNHSRQMEERHSKNNDKWGVFQEQRARMTKQHGAAIGSMMAFQQSEYGKTLDKGLSDASTLMGSKNIEMFKIGQAAAIAQAAVQIPMSAISAYTSMASIPIVGPALGIAAAAAAIAAGTMNIQKIKSQRPPGSQAHGGLDSVPKSMDNSTFLLKAGERVVQPDANKDLTQAIDKINNGGSGGHTINISVNGSADTGTIEKIKQAVMDGIREASERGVPVINSRGITQG